MTTDAKNVKPQSTAMVTGAAAKQKTIMDLFESRKASIAAVMPRHLTPERLLKIALACTARTPTLLACTPQSLLLAVMQAAELGLEAGGLLGDGYLVPYKDEAKLIIGYRGLIKLARQSGQMASLEAYVVRKNDVFEIEFGLEPKLMHRPHMTGIPDDKDIVAVYAIARFKDGARQVDVMTRAEVDAIRARSKSGNDGPWVTDFAEMAKKTVVKRLAKYLPLSPELAKALEHETAIEQNVASPVIDVEVVQSEPSAPPQTRADIMKEKLSDAPMKADADGVVAPS